MSTTDLKIPGAWIYPSSGPRCWLPTPDAHRLPPLRDLIAAHDPAHDPTTRKSDFLLNRFDVVSDQAGAVSEDCNLQLEASKFYAELGPAGQATGVSVALDGSYQCESDGRMPIQLSASLPVHGKNNSEIVAAFQRAMDSVIVDLLAET